jgi:hypothetical protein
MLKVNQKASRRGLAEVSVVLISSMSKRARARKLIDLVLFTADINRTIRKKCLVLPKIETKNGRTSTREREM